MVNNAIKHTHEDTRKIVINVKKDSKIVHIEISDNGAGIKPSNLERIFEPFISIASEYSVKGTGIGLHLSRIIIKKHGETIKAHNDGLGRGSTFKITLPINFILNTDD